jgi:hypothetical protein
MALVARQREAEVARAQDAEAAAKADAAEQARQLAAATTQLKARAGALCAPLCLLGASKWCFQKQTPGCCCKRAPFLQFLSYQRRCLALFCIAKDHILLDVNAVWQFWANKATCGGPCKEQHSGSQEEREAFQLEALEKIAGQWAWDEVRQMRWAGVPDQARWAGVCLGRRRRSAAPRWRRSWACWAASWRACARWPRARPAARSRAAAKTRASCPWPCTWMRRAHAHTSCPHVGYWCQEAGSAVFPPANRCLCLVPVAHAPGRGARAGPATCTHLGWRYQEAGPAGSLGRPERRCCARGPCTWTRREPTGHLLGHACRVYFNVDNRK